MANQVNVNTTTNQVTVTQGTTQIVTVSAQGPQGIQGPAGVAGPSGSIANTGSFATTGSNSFIGNQIITGSLSVDSNFIINQITASGDISASNATITALTGSFNHIITDDDTIEFRSKSTGVQTGRLKFDPTTGLNVQDNTGARTKIRAGRGEFLSLEAGPVGFNSLGSITASVNISASGDIVGSNLSGTNTGDQDLSNLVTNSSTASFAITGSDVIFGNITSSGNISASGDLTVNNINVENDIIVADELRLRAGGSVSPGFAILDSVNLGLFQNQVILAGGDGIVEIEIGKSTSSNRKIEIYGQITASGNISASGDIIANKVTADVVDTSFETFLNFEAATAFTFIAPFPLTINFTGSSTSSMDVVGFVTASANTSTFSVQQTPPITLNIFDKLKITPSASGLFSFSGSRTI